MPKKTLPNLIKRLGYSVTDNARKTAYALAVTVTCFVVFGLVASYFVTEQTAVINRQTMRDAARRTADDMTNRLQDTNDGRVPTLATVDPASLAGFAASFRLPNVKDIAIAKTDGEIIYSDSLNHGDLEPTATMTALAKGFYFEEPLQENGATLDLYLPLRRGQEAFGVLKISYDWTAQRRAVQLAVGWVWGGTLGTALFVSLGLWLAFRLMNRELRRRHRALTAILERAPIGIYTVSPNGRIDSFNPKMVELSGATKAEDVIGLNVFEMPSYRAANLIEDVKAGLEGKSFDRELEYVSFTAGRRTWRHYRGAPIFLPDGKTVERLLLLVEDVTVQKELEQRNIDYAKTLEQYAWERTRQLGEVESRLKAVVEKAPLVLWAIDENGVFTLSEGSGLAGLGLKPGQVVGQSAYDLYKGNDTVLGMVKDLLAGKESSVTNVVGERRFQVFANPILKADGHVGGATGVSIDVTDRYHAEQRFAAMVNNSADVITLLDVKGTITFITPPCERIVGYRPEEMTGRNLAEFLHPDDWPRIAELLGHTDPPGTLITLTARFHHKDGHYVDVESVGQDYLADPHVSGIVVNSRDITERLKAESRLRRSLTTQEAMAGISAHFIAQTDFAEAVRLTLQDIGKATGADNTFYYRFRNGGTMEENGEWTAQGRPPLLPAIEEALGTMSIFKKFISQGQEFSVIDTGNLPAELSEEKAFLQNNGILGLRLVPVIEQEGGFISLIGAAVTSLVSDPSSCNSPILNVAAEIVAGANQRRQAFETARHQAEQQAAVAAYGEAIINEADQRVILEAGASSVRRLLGADYVSILEYRKTTSDFVMVSGSGWDKATYGRTVVPGGSNSQSGFTVISGATVSSEDVQADSRFRVWEGALPVGIASGATVLIGDSHAPWGVLACHFKSRRRLTEAELGFLEAIAHLVGMGLRRASSEAKTADLDRLKSKFVQVVSHQFRTPLSAVRWNLESILSGDAGPISTEIREFLRITYEANNEVIGRIRDLLTVLDIEERRVTLSVEPVSLESLVTSLAGEHGKRFALKRVQLETVMPSSPLPPMRLDPDRVRAAMEKLLDNALDYTAAEGRVTLSLERAGDRARITVADTGIGIPEAEQIRVFERFFRASNASTMRPDASGLGLTIAKYFVDQHDGSISFSSKEGQGTSFVIELPIR